ncbi:acyltransferase family protein [Lactobacillus sp. ESL0684]|uniref:acyltransferase family protein n=1 Tax=Lactobacillus sp. ESL0684 TaxID=2983213 RepID=UPI0023F98E7E|nr:acyltransferase family protein [Lactobacillus sp. ESL0684]WEV43393.1 acyltransferase family protein [Lactobacillus sp. ESL0684]
METQSEADVGDYLKVFACTAVMLQSILSFILNSNLTKSTQITIGLIFNLVKFTAPAFIFGILYTSIRTSQKQLQFNYHSYLSQQLHNLFIPTILWTCWYLLVMPQLQQHGQFTNWQTWLKQFFSGNAAPHLWYSCMMLQFIIFYPLFLKLITWVNHSSKKCSLVISLAIIGQLLWLVIYRQLVFQGNTVSSWYWLDRLGISFLIYGILGSLAGHFRQQFSQLIKRFSPVIILVWIIAYWWINHQLLQYGMPIKLEHATYYQVSTTLYDLATICLIALLAFNQISHSRPWLRLIHFLATYAYRAFLGHIFWLELLWLNLEKIFSKLNPLLNILILTILTWLLSFACAIMLHVISQKIKIVLQLN